jgi:hypothetical protein
MVAVAELTLQVDEQTTLTPSFTHTAVSNAFSRIFNWGLKLDTTANRTYNETVVFLFNPDDPNRVKPCEKNSDLARHSITSDLGLPEVLERGLQPGTAHGRLAPDPRIDAAKAKTAFGQTVNFVVTMNMNGVGPTWSITYFKGPGPYAPRTAYGHSQSHHFFRRLCGKGPNSSFGRGPVSEEDLQTSDKERLRRNREEEEGQNIV